VARQLAEKLDCVVVLKSHVTVVASAGGRLAVNDEAGNPGMAKGGSGDVLAGVIAGLLAQGLHAFSAAAAGVWLHAAAGDLARKRYGAAGLSPADLPLMVARVLRGMER
jgi:NAD(P)H-hydrate epimerase